MNIYSRNVQNFKPKRLIHENCLIFRILKYILAVNPKRLLLLQKYFLLDSPQTSTNATQLRTFLQTRATANKDIIFKSFLYRKYSILFLVVSQI